MMDKVAVGQVLLRIVNFFASSVHPRFILIHLSITDAYIILAIDLFIT